MLRNTLKKRVLSTIISARNDVISIILFGSTIYMGRGKDLDIIVIVEKYIKDQVNDSIDLRLRVNKELRYKIVVDIHVFTINDFKNNLKPGTFLSGIALGYEVLYDKSNGLINKLIENMLELLSRDKYTLVNRYGKWQLNIHAQHMLRRIRSRIVE